MRHARRWIASGLVLLGAALAAAALLWSPAAPAADKAPEYRTLQWEDLMPPGWDPMKVIDLAELGRLNDGDPRANAIMQKLRRLWDNAPARAELQGAQVRLPGYVVPLGTEGKQMREFLLVPYFGACIHMPPPPSNQVVHVILDQPMPTPQMMDPMWVSGRLQVGPSRTEMGQASYRMAGRKVEPHR